MHLFCNALYVFSAKSLDVRYEGHLSSIKSLTIEELDTQEAVGTETKADTLHVATLCR